MSLETTCRQLLTAAALLVSINGCADLPEGESDDGTETALSEEPSSELAQVTKPAPSGVFFSKVTASGPGCPGGTWKDSISSDGKVFTLTFSQYTIRAQPSDKVTSQTTECLVLVSLSVPRGISYAVQKFSYGGYAHLQDGMVAEQSVMYGFQGQGVTTQASINRMTGPFDDSYLFTDDVEQRVTNLSWSPCNSTRILQLRTRLTIKNSDPKGSGYLNLLAIDGNAMDSKIELRLAQRACTR